MIFNWNSFCCCNCCSWNHAWCLNRAWTTETKPLLDDTMYNSSQGGGSLIPKWAKFASYIRSRTLTLTVAIVTKMLSKIADVLRFFETFSSLIPVASFASGCRHPALGTPEGTPPRSGWRRPCAHYAPSIRYEKSLQNLKNQWSQSIFVRSPKIKTSSPRSHR